MESDFPEASLEFSSLPNNSFKSLTQGQSEEDAVPLQTLEQAKTLIEALRAQKAELQAALQRQQQQLLQAQGELAAGRTPALHATEERLQMALQASHMGTFVWHVEQDHGEPDARTLALFGLGPEDSLTFDKAFHTLLHPQDRDPYAQAVASAIDPAGNGTFNVDARVVHPDGSEHWLAMAGKCFFAGEPPRPLRILGTVMDITTRKQTEIALRQAHARTVDILESTTDAFYALDADFAFTYVNQRAAQFWGRDRDALIGKHYWTEFPDAEGSQSYHMHHQAFREGKPVHYETVSPLLGTWIEASIYPGNNGGLSVFFRDISQRKKAEVTLQASEVRQAYLLRLSDRLRQLVDPVEIQYQAACVLGDYLGANRVGYAEDQGDGKTIVVTRNYTRGVQGIEGHYHYDLYSAELLRAFSLGKTVVRFDIARDSSLTGEEKAAHAALGLGATVNKPLLKKGRLVAVLFVHFGQAHHWSEGELALIEETAERVWAEVQRAKAEAALRESEARFRLLVDAVPVSIWITDAEGRVEFLNKHWCDYCGVAFNPTTAGQVAARFLHPEDGPRVMEVFGEAMQTGTSWEVEQRNRSARGEYRWFLNRAEPYRDPVSGQITKWFGVSIDIHDRKRAEQQRQQVSDELARANEDLRGANQQVQGSNAELGVAIGRLHRINADLDTFIYTASHDLKAPVANIEGLLKVLSRKMEKQSGQDEQLADILSMMEASVVRFKETINDLTDTARIQKQLDGESEPVDLGDIVQDTLLDLQEQVQASEAVIAQDLKACPPVLFPRKNLKSVVYNLLSNALKYRDPGRPSRISIACRPEGDYLVLRVQDNGLGMDVKNEDKIFGMFKRLHTHVEGTGVGLYIVRKMLENAGGRIAVESQVGVGSTFRVYFKRQETSSSANPL